MAIIDGEAIFVIYTVAYFMKAELNKALKNISFPKRTLISHAAQTGNM